jgi:predicted RNase H-like HicB family nuclease
MTMNFTLECEQEVDGRWIAEVPDLPGVLSYGDSAADAISKAEILALRVIAASHGKTAWPSVKAKRVLTALQSIGWWVK